jgi:hypothetical protein
MKFLDTVMKTIMILKAVLFIWVHNMVIFRAINTHSMIKRLTEINAGTSMSAKSIISADDYWNNLALLNEFGRANEVLHPCPCIKYKIT